MTLIGTAIRIAAQAHEGQTDKGGAPYILHPIAVMHKVAEGYTDDFRREELLCVAVLHDVLEDWRPGRGPWVGLNQLHDEIETTFGRDVYNALLHLTKKGDYRNPEPYNEYIERVAGNWMARLTKIADLAHNMDTTRLPSGKIDEKDFERWDKYRRALVRLSRET